MPGAGTPPSFASPAPTPCLLPNSSLDNSALTTSHNNRVRTTGFVCLDLQKQNKTKQTNKKNTQNPAAETSLKTASQNGRDRRSHYCFKRVSYYSVRILALPPHRSTCTVPIHPFPKQLTSKILYKAPGGSLARRAHTEYRTLGAQILVFAQAHLVCPAVVPSGYVAI